MALGERDDDWVCLMYHDIPLHSMSGGKSSARFAVPVVEFARQLDQLQAEGYECRSLGDALSMPSGHFVAITFDDGDSGQYERGFRALADRSMTATFFVNTATVNTAGHVSWAELREMRAAGMEIQSHTVSHRFLSRLSADELFTELRSAKDVLDSRLDQDTHMLALPGGDWPRRSLRHLITQTGYRVVATSHWGPNPRAIGRADQWVSVNRCTVRGSLDPRTFRRIAQGDWWLALRRRGREAALRTLRVALGPQRYSSWRRAFLDALST